MCGICGVFLAEERAEVRKDVLALMNAQIAHRGPDDDGFLVDGNVGLAMRRLSIIDVASGHQPMSNEDDSLWIVYNGEIYNHQELRRELEAKGHVYRSKSDTETVLHLYEHYGPDSVNRLRGMFAFAIWDRRSRRIFAARDRLGIKPFYYFWKDGVFVFGSEIKAILAYPGVRAQLDRDTLAEYLAFGYISGDRTMFAGIRKLLPGHTLEIAEGGQPRNARYWDMPSPGQAEARTYEYYVRTYREMLEECVSSHLMSDVPLGVFLSGGLDSSAVAALTTKLRGEPIETFSVGYAEERYSELPYARIVAEHLNSRHHEVELTCDAFFDALPHLIWHEDEPIVWPSSVSLYFVARLARERVTVVLTGEGSDETLGGYPRYAWTLANERLDKLYRRIAPAPLREWVRREIAGGSLPAVLARKLGHTFLGRDGASWEALYFDNFYSAFSAADQRALLTDDARSDAGDPYADSLRYWRDSSGDTLHRMLYTDIKTYLQELLMKQDQMSMAASVESRVPFLDHVLVEFASSIPSEFLVKGMSGKHVLKSAVEDLLPTSIVHRKKMGFPTPWERWLAGPQLEKAERLLLEPKATQRGLFRIEAVKQLFDEHRRGHRDHAHRIWRLINLELWHRAFIDRAPAVEPPISAGVHIT